mgnify:CR=1 FL=1
MLRAFIEFLSMIKWNDFVTATVYDKNRSLDVANSVNIRKFIEGQSPSKIEYNPKGRHKRTMKYYTADLVLFCQKAGWTATDRSTEENYC